MNNNLKSTNGSIEKESDENLKGVPGGFDYNHSFNYNQNEGFLLENDYKYYGLTEKERQTLRDNGCTFGLSENGEINSVMDEGGSKLEPNQIAQILGKK